MATDKNKLHLETLALHVGQEQPDPATDARAVPIYQTTSYVFRNSQHAADRFGLRDAGNIYGRLTNSTQGVFEERIAALEGGVAALAVASGAAAVTYALQNIARNGDHIIAADNLYGGSYNLITHTLSTQGVDYSIVKVNDLKALEAAIRPNTKAIYAETFGNPNSDVTDLDAIAEMAHRHNILFIVDNTFLSPHLQKPLTLGADIVVHSATKYLCGHNDIIAGILVVRQADSWYAKQLELFIKSEGPNLSPMDSWLLLRSIKTLGLRVERQAANALRLAQWLQTQENVTDIYYVGLPDHPGYSLQQKQASGNGSMISFKVKTSELARNMLGRLRLICFAESLGGVETLLTYPLSQTHAEMPQELLKRTGLDDRLLRLSVGIEDPEDLIADLSSALNS